MDSLHSICARATENRSFGIDNHTYSSTLPLLQPSLLPLLFTDYLFLDSPSIAISVPFIHFVDPIVTVSQLCRLQSSPRPDPSV